MITDDQRRQLAVADRTRDADVMRAIVDDMLVEHPDVTPIDIEIALRAVEAETYLIADHELSIVLGEDAWQDALAEAGMTPEQNRAALAAMTGD